MCVRVRGDHKTTAETQIAFCGFFGGLVVRLLITG